ncbi:MAG: hypothetical protein AAGJ38_06895 [Planctomycetota bacterium]
MSKPPAYIDNAKVLFWAWSGEKPFYAIKFTDGRHAHDIYGLAVCRYEKTNSVYRFSCDANWETQGDTDCDTVEDAKGNGLIDFGLGSVEWREFSGEM